ncbi:penicillin-binding protein [Actinomyces sp. B33]|uniref:transglycosylase domain-containing protein n=1 Tax=Actinomyces sp. B33 TaxID=2942131 RepID=UPI00233FE090|nr:transglycosylase domain-containing protein [Actinomyces sp. B33]MDC4232321.1 penicillin-binding protein [Actinomyces sp. B33]
MSSSHSRYMRPAQLVALLLAFLSVATLMGVVGAGMLIPVAGPAALTAKAAPSIFDELPDNMQVVEPAEESHMLDSTGAVIARFYDKQRIVVPASNIADVMKSAIVAIEDKRFYEHHGVDPTGIARAALNNLGGSGTQGASTITQQYVRNTLQERGYLEGDADQVAAATEQTKERKLREIKYALALEQKMSKEDILTGYLNIAPFGPITYGVEAASQRYFSKSASELDYLDAALLAGLVQSPVEYDPLSYPEAAQERRDTVLQVMLDQAVITPEEYQAGVDTPVDAMLSPTNASQGCSGADSAVAYFCDYVLGQFLADPAFGETEAEREHFLKTGGLTIRTTLDPNKQGHAFNALTGAIPVDDPSDVDDALVSVEPATGNIVAMAQNTVYGVEDGQTMSNYAADGSFQVGSTFKVFTLIQWFKEGHTAYQSVGSKNRDYGSAAFTCDGAPIYTDPYRVNDLAGKDGPMSVLKATGLSVNQAFVNMASRVDFCQIFQTAYDFGITENGEVPEAFPANVIGSSSASPLEMATAFATLANHGRMCMPNSMTTVTDRDEVTLKEYQPDCHEVVSAEVADKTATLLSQSASQYYRSTRLAEGRPFAAKSGTTDSNSNTWLTGFTPSLATSAWVGHAAASTTPVNNVVINGVFHSAIYGETFVGQNIWAPYMSAALAGTPVEAMPQANIGTPVALPQPEPAEASEEQPQSAAAAGGGAEAAQTAEGTEEEE